MFCSHHFSEVIFKTKFSRCILSCHFFRLFLFLYLLIKFFFTQVDIDKQKHNTLTLPSPQAPLDKVDGERTKTGFSGFSLGLSRLIEQISLFGFCCVHVGLTLAESQLEKCAAAYF